MEALGINLSGLIAQIINFLLLLVLLYLFVYKRVLKMLDERAKRIKESMEQTEAIKQEMARTEEQVKAQLEAGRREGQALIAQAAQAGEQLREEARQEARRETEALIARARQQIGLERDQALDELRRQFVDVALLAAEKVIKESLDRQKHQQLIEEVLEESAALKK